MKAGGIILKKNDSPAFFQSRLTDAVSVILSELLSYEHPPKGRTFFRPAFALCLLNREVNSLTVITMRRI